MLYYLPENANSNLRMLYAGAKELMRNTAATASCSVYGRPVALAPMSITYALL